MRASATLNSGLLGTIADGDAVHIQVSAASKSKCPRCWLSLVEAHAEVCPVRNMTTVLTHCMLIDGANDVHGRDAPKHSRQPSSTVHNAGKQPGGDGE
jgi:hypothetical protein